MALRPGKYDSLKPDIELIDFKTKKRFGLKLASPSSLQIGTISQDDSVVVRSSGKRIGDFDEQRTWKGGRGIENLSDNGEGYWDSNNAWTLADGHLHQTLLWRFAKGLRSADFSMPDKTHSMSWQPLIGTNLYQSLAFTSSGFSATFARLWIRRVGTPGTLTFKLYTNNAGNPGTLLQTVTKDTTNITDYISVLQSFSFNQTLTATSYHISISGASTDNKNNHWEIGGYSSGSAGKSSPDGSSWTINFFDLYYYVGDAKVSRTFFSFFLDEAMYVVDRKDAGTASQLYINGDRGKATSGAATTITDTGKAWTSNRWSDSGAFVKIIRGTGASQFRAIVSNTTTTLTVSDWAIPPDSTSEYIIYATDWWTEITGHGLGLVNSTPVVVNQIVYFPVAGANVRRMVWVPASNAHAYSDDGANQADYITSVASSGVTYVVKALKSASTVAFAPSTAYASPPTNLVYGTARIIGSSTYKISGLLAKENYVFVFKENGVWNIDNTLNTVSLQSGMEKTPSPVNGAGNIVHQQFAYYSWQHSLIRVYNSSHDDIGQDWSGKGLPDGREGNFASLDAYTSLLMCAINAGTGTSCVLSFDGMGWHELFRAFEANQSIRMVKVQPNEGTRNRTWIEIGGDMVYQEMPYMKGSPRLDTGCRYFHEAVVESAAIDMGTASGLPKYIKELTVCCDNLGNKNDCVVDFQIDSDVGTTTWTEATTLYDSPEAVATLNLNNIRKFAYRLRIRSGDNTKPVDVRGVIPNGYARSPYKMVWTMSCRADNISSQGRIVKPDILMRWLLDNARFPGRILMLSQFELAHKFYVIIHPPRMFPYKPAAAGQAEESQFTIVLEEA